MSTVRSYAYALVGLLTLLPAVASAQPAVDRAVRDRLAWSESRRGTADKLSTLLVSVALTHPCLLQHPEDGQSRKDCLFQQGKRVGAAIAFAELSKRLIARARPDGSDDKSFFSEHTAIACAATATKKTWPICAAAAYLRVAAHKHWFTDVLTGAALGTVSFQFTWR